MHGPWAIQTAVKSWNMSIHCPSRGFLAPWLNRQGCSTGTGGIVGNKPNSLLYLSMQCTHCLYYFRPLIRHQCHTYFIYTECVQILNQIIQCMLDIQNKRMELTPDRGLTPNIPLANALIGYSTSFTSELSSSAFNEQSTSAKFVGWIIGLYLPRHLQTKQQSSLVCQDLTL